MLRMQSPNSDQHTSTLEEEDPAIQNIPRSINHLEQCLVQAQTRLEHLNGLTIPHSELTTDFALPKTAEMETEKNRIRTSDIMHVRQMAESYLLRLRDAERRNIQQSQRMHALETRVTMAESICAEQMRLNREVADESIRTLRQFADMERKRISIVKTANARVDSMARELNRYRNQCEQHEQTISRLREQSNVLNQEATSLTQQHNKLQSEKNALSMERDRFAHETDTIRTQLSQRDELIEALRDREHQLTTALRERDADIEAIREERDESNQKLVNTRREHADLMAQKELDIGQFVEIKRREAIAEVKATYRAEVEKYKKVAMDQREDFKRGLEEALLECQKLAAERVTYYNNWRHLEKTLESHKLKLNAALKRKMVSKCAELVRDLNDVGGFQNGASTAPPALEPIENVAQRFLDGLSSQRESGLS